MKLARRDRRLLAWMLLLCILFSALHCASGLGQMVAMQLTEVVDEHAHHQHAEAASAHSHSSMDSGCDFASPFSAIILAAFFGLLGRLSVETARPLPAWILPRQPRLHWPPVNPRAPPQLLPVL